MDFFKVKHSFAAGDLISVLPGLKHLYESTGKKSVIYQRLNFQGGYYAGAIHSTKDESGNDVCMSLSLWGRLLPLLKSQEYIQDALVWEGQEVDYDLDLSRFDKMIPMPSAEIYSWNWCVFPEMACDLSRNWLNVGYSAAKDVHTKIIINRTERYINPYISFYFLKPHQDRLLFSGTQREYELFCEQWQLSISKIETQDFLETARVIKSAKFFIGNQSLHFHLANAMHTPRILELCPSFPNTFPVGANGFAFNKQLALEYYFNKLLNR